MMISLHKRKLYLPCLRSTHGFGQWNRCLLIKFAALPHLEFCGPLPDGDGIYDLTARLFKRCERAASGVRDARIAGVPPALFSALRGLPDAQAAIHRFVGHAHALIIGILDLRPPRSLFPATNPESVCSQPSSATWYAWPGGTAWGGKAESYARLVRFLGAMRRTATMPGHLTAHRGRGALQSFGDIKNGRTGREPSRELRTPRTRNDPTVMCQQTVNGGMRPDKGAPDRKHIPASNGCGELQGNQFSNNSLFILNIGDAAKMEGAGRLVFMRGSWSSCPAEQWVPAMLEGVWLRAPRSRLSDFGAKMPDRAKSRTAVPRARSDRRTVSTEGAFIYRTTPSRVWFSLVRSGSWGWR